MFIKIHEIPYEDPLGEALKNALEDGEDLSEMMDGKMLCEFVGNWVAIGYSTLSTDSKEKKIIVSVEIEGDEIKDYVEGKPFKFPLRSNKEIEYLKLRLSSKGLYNFPFHTSYLN